MHSIAPDLDPRPSPDGWLDLGPGWLFASIRDAVIVADTFALYADFVIDSLDELAGIIENSPR
jgi:hypothetical protein